LGDTQGRLPNDQGFDEWWGYPNSADEAGYSAWPLFKESGFPTPMLLEGKKGEPSRPVMPFDLDVRPRLDGEYIVPKTIDFIKREAAAKRPFFVYVGYSELHPPCIPNPEFARKSRERSGIFSDIIAEMDYRVGEILDAIREAGVQDDTIVIVSSDNGTGGVDNPPGGSNGPWRGNFLNAPFEGNHRVPAIIRWPGQIAAGSVTNQMLAAVDWLPTLASLAQASSLVPTDRPIDGVDSSAFMLRKKEQTGRDAYMFFGTDGQLLSVKWRHYKIIFRYSDGLEVPYVTPQFPMIYDLVSDPHEDFNLFSYDMTVGWLLAPAFRLIGEYQTSVGKYPNIRTGEDFRGYNSTPR
jgi:arylsulfatase